MNQQDKKPELDKARDLAKKNKDNPFEVYNILSTISNEGSKYVLLQGFSQIV